MRTVTREWWTVTEPLVMAIVNRTPDSFFDQGATYGFDTALRRVEQVISEGADIVDIGGVKAGYGPAVSTEEELARVVDFVAKVRAEFPDICISVDTWRSEVAEAVLECGADIINDPWGGPDERLPEVVARLNGSLLCAHAGGLGPRTDPHRIEYADVVSDVLSVVGRQVDRALRAGVGKERIIIDPAHDFGKNTVQSLEVTRRLGELVQTGWPVLVSLSNKDFVGETLDRPVGERLMGTLAATAVCAMAGARLYRVHQVAETRDVVDMVWSIKGDRLPARAIRGLA